MLVLYRLQLKKQSSGAQICQIEWIEGSWRRITLFCDIGDVRGDVKYCQECLCCWTIQNNNTNKNCYLCKGVFQQPSCSSPQQRWVMKWDSLEVSVIISLQYETCMLRPCKWQGTRKELEVPCTTPQCQFQLQADRCCNTPGNVPGRLTPRTGLRSHHTHTPPTRRNGAVCRTADCRWDNMAPAVLALATSTCCFNSWYHCLAF